MIRLVRAPKGSALKLGTVLTVLLAPVLARADAPDPGALFDRGLADMQAHRYGAACPELAESYRLDPHAGGLFTLAECENQWGKIASAMSDYDTFLDLVAHLPPKDRAKQDERARVAAEKRAALEREVPTVTVTLDATVPAGSTVTIDGRAVAAASLGSATRVDPGDHVVKVEAPDGRTNEEHVSLAKRDARAVTLSLPPAQPSASPAPAAPAETGEPGKTQRTAAYVTAGVGGAAVVAGVVMGAVVLADKSTIDKDCPTPTTCATSADASNANSARTLGWASTGVLIGGGAALCAAAILWFTRPKSAPLEPVIAPARDGAWLGLQGVW
jgi:PEGA domain